MLYDIRSRWCWHRKARATDSDDRAPIPFLKLLRIVGEAFRHRCASSTVPVLRFVPLSAGRLRSQPRRSQAPQLAVISARSVSMNTFIVAIVRTRRNIRRGPTNPISRFTRKVSINLALTTSLPAFVKLAID